MNKAISIRSLSPENASLVSAFMKSQPAEYMRFFYAFGSDDAEIARILSAARRDVYSGIFWQDDLIGIFMLRGWDEGYDVPSLGVLIGEKYRGGTLMRLAVDAAKLTCRLSGTKRIMAKLHLDNVTPLGAKRFGFRQTGTEESTGNIIYHLEL